MSREHLFRHPGIRILLRAVRQEAIFKLIAALILLAFGLSMMYFNFRNNAIFTILGLVCACLGLLFTLQILKTWRTEDHRLIYLLRKDPRQIVWVYSLITDRQPFGFRFIRAGTLYFKLMDGDEITVAIPSHRLKLVSRTLIRLLPHATFGYSADNDQWYATDPALLLRSDENKEKE